MSDPVTALKGATFADGVAEVTEAPIQGMITLRENALIKLMTGETTYQEVLRVTWGQS